LRRTARFARRQRPSLAFGSLRARYALASEIE